MWPRLSRDFRRLRAVKGRGLVATLIDACLFDSGFQAVVAHRIAHACVVRGIPVIPAICRRWAVAACAVDILPRADLGGGLILAHGVGTVIGGTAQVGEDCTILHGVTLGEARFDELACPTVGDRVTIGAGAILLGGIQIGDDAIIAAGAVVTSNVEAGSTVAGVPARALPRRD